MSLGIEEIEVPYNNGGIAFKHIYCTLRTEVADDHKIKLEVVAAPVLESGESIIPPNCPWSDDYNPEEIIGCILCSQALMELDNGKRISPFADKYRLKYMQEELRKAREALEDPKIKKWPRIIALQIVNEYGFLDPIEPSPLTLHLFPDLA